MYQAQPHYQASSTSGAQGNGISPMQVPLQSLPSAPPNVVHHHPYNGGVGMPRSAARSMPTGHCYLNGSSLPDYGLATSLTNNQSNYNFPLRHNSGVGSNDNLGSSITSLNRLHQPNQQIQPQVLPNSVTQSVSASQASQMFHINVINEKDPCTNIVRAYKSKNAQEFEELHILRESYFDKGAFGTVYRARILNHSNHIVAVKSVIQDKRYRNRELPLMKRLSHENIVKLYYFYFSSEIDNKNEKFLNLVMEFMPKNVSHLIPRKQKTRDPDRSILTPFVIKIVMYQIFRALSYIHTNGICHRDIKPNNLLFNPNTGAVKVCDFGSAKELVPGERNVSYICARYYRAPELLFGATDYTNMIDLWSTGIVWSELLLGYPIFHENSGIDQLVNIISKLGTPTKEEIQAMNRDYLKYDLPLVAAAPFHTLLPTATTPEALDLIRQLFQYDPKKRILPLSACAHSYFDELRDPSKKWVNGGELPPLFNFTENELSANPSLSSRLMPRTTTPVSMPQYSGGPEKSSIPIAVNNKSNKSSMNVFLSD